MKKILALLFIAFFLVSCFNKEETKKETSTSTGTWVSVENEKLKVVYDWIKMDTSEENISKEREEIKSEDLDMLFIDDKKVSKNPLLEVWKKFLSNINETKEASLTQKIDGWVEFEDYMKEIKKIPEEIRRDFSLNLEITDWKSWEKIKKWNIYVNGIKFWEFKDWAFEKDFIWPKWIEKFNIIVRTDNYGDAFISLGSQNLEWSYLKWFVKLKKLDFSKKVSLRNTPKIDAWNLSMKIDDCSLVNSTWECHKWEVQAKLNFVSWKSVNSWESASLNMKAITKEWKIVNLESGWMAFTDFVTNDWEILKVKDGKKMEITYKVTDEEIKDMKNNLFWNWKNNGYWLYDKNKNIWIEKEAEYKLDEKNKTWTVIVSEIY